MIYADQPYETIPGMKYYKDLRELHYDSSNNNWIIRYQTEIVGYVYFDDTADCYVLQFKKPVDKQVLEYGNDLLRDVQMRYGQ